MFNFFLCDQCMLMYSLILNESKKSYFIGENCSITSVLSFTKLNQAV